MFSETLFLREVRIMEHEARIDVATDEQPRVGEKFYINLQENSEMLGLLDGGRTFRFKSASDADKAFAQDNRVLKVVSFKTTAGGHGEESREGALRYTD
jgi:hypothetical protein